MLAKRPLTDRAIAALKPAPKARLVWDAIVPGFATHCAAFRLSECSTGTSHADVMTCRVGGGGLVTLALASVPPLSRVEDWRGAP